MNSLHGNVEVESMVARPCVRSISAVAGVVTGSFLSDLRGFSTAEILITRRGSRTTLAAASFSNANTLIFYARHSNTLGAAQVKVPATDLVFDLVGAGGISGAYSSDTAAGGATGRIYTARTTFANHAYPAGSVTLALNNIKVGYHGDRRYLRVGFLASGAAATNTGVEN